MVEGKDCSVPHVPHPPLHNVWKMNYIQINKNKQQKHLFRYDKKIITANC